jgi:hypothetical protein
MTTHTDAEHAYFARVPDRLLAELRSPSGPVLTFVEADGQLHVNEAALNRLLEDHRRRPASAPVVAPPVVFIPSRACVSRREGRAA